MTNFKKRKIMIFISIIAAAIITGCNSGNYDSFAQCLTDKEVKFYGAYWCPHCATQKEMFGSSFQYVNYVECSLPNKAGQTEVCIQAKIESYPTWEFDDGSRVTGVQSLQQLALQSGCSLE